MFTHAFRNLSNIALHAKLSSLVADERRLTLEVLHHLRECEKRRLYAERGHSSLFEYATRELGYSESAAQRRISTMRALREVPEIAQKLETGELKLTQVAQAQTFFRNERKLGKSYSNQQKRDLFRSMEGRSSRDTEKLLAERSPESVHRMERIQPIAPNLNRILFTAEDALVEKLAKVRDRFAHQLPASATLEEVISFLADKILKEPRAKKLCEEKSRATDKRGSIAKTTTETDEETETNARTMVEANNDNEVAKKKKIALNDEDPLPAPEAKERPRSRYIPIEVRREVWRRDKGKCTYRSALTQKTCQSTHRLQIDHIRPFALGGSSTDPANLRLLCFRHNQTEAALRFGDGI